MAKAHDVQEILAQEVKPGYTLVIPDVDGKSSRLFNVEAIGFTQIVDSPAMMRFTSEIVPPAARPTIIERPVGSTVLRLLRTYDNAN